MCVEGRAQFEGSGLSGEIPQAQEAPLSRPVLRDGKLVPRNMERRSLPPVGGLHLDESGMALRGVTLDVVPRAVAVFVRHPSHAPRQVGTADVGKDGPFVGEHARFSGASERLVALGSCGHVEFARDRLHLIELVRRGVVPKSRWKLDGELGCLRNVGRLVHAGCGCLELGVAMQPARDSVSEGHLDIECGQVSGKPSLAEPLHDGADVPVLEFDRRAAAVEPGPKAPVVVGLGVGTSGEVGRKHREVVRDDEVVLFIRPGAGRHAGQANTGADEGHRHHDREGKGRIPLDWDWSSPLTGRDKYSP